MLGIITDGEITIMGAKKSLVKVKILKLLSIHKELTISQIVKKLEEAGDKYNYRTIWQHIETMKGDWLDVEKREHETGKPVFVKLKPILQGINIKTDEEGS